MNRINSILGRMLVGSAIIILLSSCSGDSEQSVVNSADTGRTVSGIAAKGPLAGANIEIFAFDADGNTVGGPLATTTTAANGQWSVNVPSQSNPLLVISSGGEYIDESDTSPDINQKRRITLGTGDRLFGILPPDSDTASVSILTTALIRKSRNEVTAGDFTNLLANNRNLAISAIGFDPFAVEATDPLSPAQTASANQVNYAMYLGGVAYALNSVSIALDKASPDSSILQAFIDDLSDGRLDGKLSGVPIQVDVDGDLKDMPDNINLNLAIIRFFNNNYISYRDYNLPPPEVDEQSLSTSFANRAPVANPDSGIFTPQDTPLTTPDLLLNDSDPDGDVISVVGVDQVITVGGGSVTSNGDGTFDYTPAGGFTGNFVFTYEISDDLGKTSTASVTITVIPNGTGGPTNTAPTANAGPDDTFDELTTVNLDGSGSSDSDGTISNYIWSYVSGPAISLVNPTSVNASFTAPDVASNSAIVLQLTVIDNGGLSDTDTIVISINDVAANIPPTAAAGSDQTNIPEQTVVNLDGSSSFDPDDGIASYSWVQLSGTPVTINNANTANASFTGPEVLVGNVDALLFELTVTDNSGVSDTDFASVFFIPVLNAPVANAGPDQNPDESTLVTLDASASSDDRSINLYAWNQITGPAVTLSNINAVMPTFTGPDVDGTTLLRFELTVTDDEGGTHTDTVDINLNDVGGNNPPVAANDSVVTTQDTPVDTPDVTANDTDADGDPLTIASFTQAFNGVVVDNGDKTFTYTPNGGFNGLDSFTYTITDGTAATDTATVNITVNSTNVLPTADAGVDQNVDELITVNLNDAGSNDPDGSITGYQWSQVSGTTVSINNAATATADFTSPEVLVGNVDVLIFQLEVTDDQGGVDTDFVSVIVNPVNPAPVANAGNDQTLDELLPVTLDGSASTDDRSIVSYAWLQTAGTSVSLDTSDPVMPTFTGPDIANDETLTFELTVTDDEGASDTDTVDINLTSLNAAPVANDDGPIPATEDTNLVIDIDNDLLFNDTDVDSATILFDNYTQPANGTVTGPSAGDLTYTPDPDFNGSDSFTYTAIDDEGAISAAATVSITVSGQNDDPVANPDSASTNQDAAITISDMLDNDTDIDGNPITLTGVVVTGDQGGAVDNNGNNTLTYTPPPGYVGDEDITYIIGDGQGGTANGVITVTVNADTDGDSIADADEISTSAILADTDSDNFYDQHEIAAGTDPNNDASFPVVTVLSGAATTISTDTTWTLANAPYWVQSDVVVQSGATLTIEAGVVVKLDTNIDIDVQTGGNIVTLGKSPLPQRVILTSALDDTANGDTNGDSNATSPSSGNWPGIEFFANSNGILESTDVRYGVYCVEVQDASPVLRDVEIGECSGFGIDFRIGGTSSHNVNFNDVRIVDINSNGISTNSHGIYLEASANSTLQLNISKLDVDEAGDSTGEHGLYFRQSSGSIITGTADQVAISNAAGAGIELYNTGSGLFDASLSNLAISGSGTFGIHIDKTSTADVSPVIDGTNTINNNLANYAIYVQDATPVFAAGSDTVIDGGYAGLGLDGTTGSFENITINNPGTAGITMLNNAAPVLFSNIVVNDTSVPFDIIGQSLPSNIVAGTTFPVISGMSVRFSGTIATDTTMGVDPLNTTDSAWNFVSNITINSGVTLTITDNAVIKMNAGRYIYVDGTLDVLATSGNEAIITSIKDDVLADTNQDGGATSPVRGDWNYIDTRNNAVIDINNAIIRYARHGLYSNSDSHNTTLNAVSFSEISDTGIYGLNSPVSVYNLTGITIDGVTTNGIALSGNSSNSMTLNIDGLDMSNIGNEGLYMSFSSTASMGGTLQNMIFSNIGFHAIYLVDTGTGIVDPLITGVTINPTIGNNSAITIQGGSSTTPTLNDSVGTIDINDGAYGLQIIGAGGDYSGIDVDGATTAAFFFEGGLNPGNWDDASIVVRNSASIYELTTTMPASIAVQGTADIGYTDGGGNNLSYVELAGTLTDINLVADPLFTGSSVYYASSTLSIPAGVTMTMGPNAVLKMADGTRISVTGTLNVTASDGNEAIITTIREDIFDVDDIINVTTSADTNGDGTGTVPSKGNWLQLRAYSNGVMNLQSLKIRYAQIGIYSSSVNYTASLTDVDITEMSDSGIYSYNTGASSITINSSTISGTLNDGLYFDLNAGDVLDLNIDGLVLDDIGNASTDRAIEFVINNDAAVSGNWYNITVDTVNLGDGIVMVASSGTGTITPVISGLTVNGPIPPGRSAVHMQGNSLFTPSFDNSSANINIITAATTFGMVLDGIGGNYSHIDIDGVTTAFHMRNDTNPASWDDATINVANVSTPYRLAQNLPASVGVLGFPSTDLGYTEGAGVNKSYVEVGGDLTDINLVADPLSTGESVYYGIANMDVLAGETMTLEDNAIIKMGTSIGLDVYGTFTTTSTSGNECLITSFRDDTYSDTNGDSTDTSPGYTDWSYIRGYNGSVTNLGYCTLSYADYGFYAANQTSLDFTLDNATISHVQNNGIYAYNVGTSNYTISGNSFITDVNASHGIYLDIYTGSNVVLDFDGLTMDDVGNGSNDHGIYLPVAGTGMLGGNLYNITLSNIAGNAIYIDSNSTGQVAPTLSAITINPAIGGSGIVIEGDAATQPVIDASIGVNNINAGQYGLYLDGVAGTYSDINIDGTSLSSLGFANGADPDVAMSNIVLTNTPSSYSLISQGIPANVAFDASDVTAIEDYIRLSGTLTQDTVFNADPLGTGSSWYRVVADLRTGANVLSIGEGTVMKFDDYYLRVSSGGSLNISGTQTNKVIMTSSTDDRADLILDDPATSTATDGDWSGIWFRDGSESSSIVHTNLYFPSYGLYFDDPISDSTFDDMLISYPYDGVYLAPSSVAIAPAFNNLEIVEPDHVGVFFVTTGAIQMAPVFSGDLKITDVPGGVVTDYCIYNQSPSTSINISGWTLTNCNYGIYLTGSIGGTYTNNIVRDMNVQGIRVNTSTPLIVSDNIVVNNGSTSYIGTGIYVQNIGVSSVIERNIIRDNSSSYAAMYITGTNGSVTVRNNLIVENTSTSTTLPAGVYIEDNSTLDFYNNTIADNTAGGATNTGIGLEIGVTNNSVSYHDNIIYNNQDSDSEDNIQDLSAGSTAFNNTTTDPTFESGWYLNIGGAGAIDAGSDTAANLSITGTTSVDGAADTGNVDLGYHYQAGVAAVDAANSQAFLSSPTTTQNNAVTLTVIPRDATTALIGPAIDVQVSKTDVNSILTDVVDNGDGYYTATYTPTTISGSDTLTITVNGVVLDDLNNVDDITWNP